MRCSLGLAVIVATVSIASADSRVIADRVAAVVNDQVILVSELDLRMLPLRAQAASIPDKAERDRRLARLAVQMLDEMVNDELVVQAALEAKLTVEPEEIKIALDYVKKENGFDDKQLEAEMKKQGVTSATIKNDLLRQRAVNQLIGSKIVITDEDTRARYDQLQRRADAVTGVNISQLVFGLPERPSVQQLADVKQQAHRVVERIKAGEALATIAGDVKGATFTDGQWLDAGTVIPELETVVFGMDKHDVRGPVEAPGGVYVLYANDVRRTQLDPYPAMKEKLAAGLRREALTKQTRAWIEELRKKAYIDIKLH